MLSGGHLNDQNDGSVVALERKSGKLTLLVGMRYANLACKSEDLEWMKRFACSN